MYHNVDWHGFGNSCTIPFSLVRLQLYINHHVGVVVIVTIVIIIIIAPASNIFCSCNNWLLLLISEARWCTINSYEMAKCTELQLAIQSRILANRTYPIGITKRYDDLPEFKCIPGTDQYDCMEKISQGDAHLMQLETGLSYTAGEYYNMLPLVAEQYVLSKY